ncbi:cytochrome P450 [Linderina pennispora]|uniref:Cytochrome P450 n=1 Tax=Linderina pennispora TaxID=61395 RepID=A0A1Y1W765_9FUNG|nr:cytochrome P450 [Linderina pennispora]ORX69272.1 cytochrome P450 [Linderina pennispora]
MHYSDVYGWIAEEVRSAFPDSSQFISFADAKNKLPFLSAVIGEGLCLNPAFANMLQRCVPADGVTIQGYFTPGGSSIGVSIAACHPNRCLWPNPDRFDPEYFLGADGTEKDKDIPTFSSGVRLSPMSYTGMIFPVNQHAI